MDEKAETLFISVPPDVAKAAAHAYDAGDHSYNIELSADIGDGLVPFSLTNKINVRYIYVTE